MYKEKLKELLLDKVMPDVERVIDKFFKKIERDKTISLGEREDLNQLQELHKECREILIEIESGELEEDEAKEIYEELSSYSNNQR
ncbi:MAG: hypothetical protein GXO02_05175 [Epsilonproteobacteria bacterium]|nr:hypothetical protein [Campylobacterota bacterium]